MYLISDGGASCNLPDTKEAIMLTKNIDYLKGIKLDIGISHDNVILLCPSDNLSDFTLSNKLVHEESYAYLRKVKFPSHIFKYYIPSLEEILISYNPNKIIILDFKYLDNNMINYLYELLIKYSYQYYYLINDNNEEIIKSSKLMELGKILSKNDYIYVNNLNNISVNDDNIYIISKYPEKIHAYFKKRQI